MCRYYDWTNVRLVGYGNVADRQPLIDDFNNCNVDRIQCLIGTYRTIGTGFNITRVTQVLLFDLEWTTCPEKQAIGHVHRKGQDFITRSYRLVSEAWIEQQIKMRQIDRELVNNKAFGIEEDPNSGKKTVMSESELEALLKDSSGGVTAEMQAYMDEFLDKAKHRAERQLLGDNDDDDDDDGDEIQNSIVRCQIRCQIRYQI